MLCALRADHPGWWEPRKRAGASRGGAEERVQSKARGDGARLRGGAGTLDETMIFMIQIVIFVTVDVPVQAPWTK